MKRCAATISVPWEDGHQHKNMNEFLLSMDQVAAQLLSLCNDPEQKISDAHRTLVNEAHECVEDLVDKAWEACVLGAAGVLEAGDEQPEGEGEDEAAMLEAARERARVKRLVEAYRMSTQLRIASENYENDESIREALSNFRADMGSKDIKSDSVMNTLRGISENGGMGSDMLDKALKNIMAKENGEGPDSEPKTEKVCPFSGRSFSN